MSTKDAEKLANGRKHTKKKILNKMNALQISLIVLACIFVLQFLFYVFFAYGLRSVWRRL